LSDSDDLHVWVRFRFKPWRLPPDVPRGINSNVLLRRRLKAAGRYFGLQGEELRNAVDDGRATLPARPQWARQRQHWSSARRHRSRLGDLGATFIGHPAALQIIATWG
jgi:hypothetical protein